MALFVYPTEDCLADAQTHGLSYEVEKLIQRVEGSQSLSVFDPFPPPYLVKKKLGGRQGRLIASRQSVGDHAVVVLLAVMIWKDHRFTAASSGTAAAGAASILNSTPSPGRQTDAGTSVPATAALHSRLPSDRADLVDDREVIIRHFGRPTPKRAAVIDAKSGIKHISDMN